MNNARLNEELWIHNTSGDVYLVRFDLAGQLIEACGPMYYRNIPDAIRNGWDGDSDLARELRSEWDAYAFAEHQLVYLLGQGLLSRDDIVNWELKGRTV